MPFLSVKQIAKLQSPHRQKPKISCRYCNEIFSHQHYKNVHEIHNCLLKPHSAQRKEFKSHPCTVCHKTYSLESSLNYHIKHDCQKVHNCTNCGRMFSQINNLRRHLRSETCSKMNKINPL